MFKKTLMVSVVAATLPMGNAMAVEGLSANVGVVSDYYFRGVQQTSSASANGGIDYEHESGFYAGMWAADVEGQSGNPAPGIEIDTYLGFAGEVGVIGYSVGVTHYGYTGDFDTSYDEVNLGAGYGPVSLEIASGSHEAAVSGDADDDYTFAAISYGAGPFTAKYGAFGGDWGGSYIEVGLSTEIAGAEAGITVINGNPDDNFTGTGTNTTDGTGLIFSLSKSFDL